MQILPPFVHLVDIDGLDVPLTERFDGPPVAEIDPTNPATWPAWCDNWHWEVDPVDQAELEAAECECLTDLADLPALCGGSPEPFEPTAEDLAEVRAMFDRTDGMSFPREATRADRHAFAGDVAAFYHLHPAS